MLTVGQVDYISPDSLIYTSAVISENDSESWGLARLSHTTLLTTNKSKHTYGYDDSAGEGTRAYIIDTGIFAEHDVGICCSGIRAF